MSNSILNSIGTWPALLGLLVLGLSGCSGPVKEVAAATTPPAQEGGSQVLCAAHEAPVNLCFICDATLREKGRLWCKEHARYEDRCWLCHPELEDKSRLYCAEHALYEDECFLCHPELLEEKPTAAAPVPATPQAIAADLMCAEHDVLERECGICHPELLAGTDSGNGLKLRLPSAASATKAGIALGTATAADASEGVPCFAELTFDLNRVARITPLVEGVVQSMEVDLGSRVRRGDVLARLASVGISEAQSRFVTAAADEAYRAQRLERERSLHQRRVSSQQDLQEAEALYRSAAAALAQARQQLLVLGFAPEQIEQVGNLTAPSGVLEIRAPFDGEVIERAAVRGAMIRSGETMLVLADTTKLWATVSIPEAELGRVRPGQSAELRVEAFPNEAFPAVLSWVGAQLDGQSRMAVGRLELDNADGRLKARMFARARIITDTRDGSLVVPGTAVQSITGRDVVFIRLAEDLFEVRPVRLGVRGGNAVEVVDGLRPGEPIAVSGSFALKSQFLISRLGAGCVH